MNHSFIVDSGGNVAESNEDNNVVSLDLGPDRFFSLSQIRNVAPATENGAPPPPALPPGVSGDTQGQPDLVLSVSVGHVDDDGDAYFLATVTNAGTAASGPATLLSCVINCLEFPFPALAPGEVREFYHSYPRGLGSIPHMAMADSNRVVAESNEGNNYFEGNLGG
jgi:hypothetical protein